MLNGEQSLAAFLAEASVGERLALVTVLVSESTGRDMQATLAHYLAELSLAELFALVSALAGECSARGIRTSELVGPLGHVQARLEYRAESEASR